MDAAHAWAALVGLIAGLVAGSFLTVAVPAAAGRTSLRRLRSACPSCGRKLTPLELIPLVSWLLQRGRCRGCAEPIDWLHPALEAACGLAGALALGIYGPTWLGLARWIFLVALAGAAVADARYGIIPDIVSLPGALLGLILAAPAGQPGLGAALVGCLAGAGGLFVLAWAYSALRGLEGLGMGDVKLAALLGAHLGLAGAILAAWLGAVLALALRGTLVALGRRSWHDPFAFGPYLALGGALSLVPLFNDLGQGLGGLLG